MPQAERIRCATVVFFRFIYYTFITHSHGRSQALFHFRNMDIVMQKELIAAQDGPYTTIQRVTIF